MTRFEVAAGFSLNVECAGTGPPVVLLHGFTGSARSWDRFGELLAQLFTTVAVDIIGHGASDAPATVDRYRMAVAAGDLVAAAGAAGFERAPWIGYSMGGRTALHVAAAVPAAVERLVLIGASPGLASPDERRERVAADSALASRILRDGVAQFVDYWQDLPLFASQRRLPAGQRERIRSDRLARDPLGLANSLLGMGTGAQEPLHARLATIDVPALVLAGDGDTKYIAIGEEMAAAMPGAAFMAVPSAGHAAHLENPGFCAEAISRFLDKEVAP